MSSFMWDLRKDVDVQYFINYLNTVVPGKWCFSEKELGVCRRTPNNFIDSADCSLKIEKSW